jgi:hypothetical protein
MVKKNDTSTEIYHIITPFSSKANNSSMQSKIEQPSPAPLLRHPLIQMIQIPFFHPTAIEVTNFYYKTTYNLSSLKTHQTNQKK